MTRFLFACAALAFATTVVAVEDPKPQPEPQPAQPRVVPVQPKGIQVRPAPAQPIQPGRILGGNRIAAIEEEIEVLEAQRDVRKAYVKAAEVAVTSTEMNVEILGKVGELSVQERNKIKIELEAAKAQLEIRIAEMKEVEVKIKHAKRRLEDATPAGGRPGIRPVQPKAVDPQLTAVNAAEGEKADPKVIAELQKQIKQLEAVVADKKAAVEKAEAVAKETQSNLARTLDIAKRGRVLPGTIEKAQAASDEARAKAEKATDELKKSEAELANAKAKLKEIE